MSDFSHWSCLVFGGEKHLQVNWKSSATVTQYTDSFQIRLQTSQLFFTCQAEQLHDAFQLPENRVQLPWRDYKLTQGNVGSLCFSGLNLFGSIQSSSVIRAGKNTE